MSGQTYQFTDAVIIERWSDNAQGVPERSTYTLPKGTPFTVAHIPTYGANPLCDLRIERDGQSEAMRIPWNALMALTTYAAS